MTDQSTALATTSANESSGELAAIDNEIRQFDFDWRRAKAFSMSRMVPAHFQNKPEDCMVAVMMARQLGVDPLLALQNVQVVNGRPGFSASFAIGLANQRGPFAGPITWTSKGKGDTLEVTAHGVVKVTGEKVSATVSMEIAKAEGWVKNPKYRTMPEQMLRYRSGTWLIRLHCPEVLLGLSSSEELEDIHPVTVRAEAPVASSNVVAELNEQIMQQATTAPTVEQQEVEDVEVVSDDPF
jgi:hypothetical protein